jgi:hypothetical protein
LGKEYPLLQSPYSERMFFKEGKRTWDDVTPLEYISLGKDTHKQSSPTPKGSPSNVVEGSVGVECFERY